MMFYDNVPENRVNETCPIKEKAQLLAKILGIRDEDVDQIKRLISRADRERLKASIGSAFKATLGRTSRELEENFLDSVEKVLLGRCREGVWATLLKVGYRGLKDGIDLFAMQAAFAAAVKTLRAFVVREEEARALARKTLWSLVMISEGYRFLVQKTVYEGLGVNKALFQRLLEKYVDEALTSPGEPEINVN